jgi:hypothetical protein
MYIYSKIKYTVVVLLGRCMVLVWRNINEQKKEPCYTHDDSHPIAVRHTRSNLSLVAARCSTPHDATSYKDRTWATKRSGMRAGRGPRRDGRWAERERWQLPVISSKRHVRLWKTIRAKMQSRGKHLCTSFP